MKIFGRWQAKRQYARETEDAAHRVALDAELAATNAANARKQAETLEKEAQAIEDNIKAHEEKLECGYWECENGHEYEGSGRGVMILPAGVRAPTPTSADLKDLKCPQCKKDVPLKYVKLDRMTGQEKYESDQQRKDAEKMAANYREKAKDRIEFADGAEQTSVTFRKQAQRGFDLAKKIRNL